MMMQNKENQLFPSNLAVIILHVIFIANVLPLSKCGSDQNNQAENTVNNILTTQQYHFIVGGGYFQYSLSTAELDFNGDILNQIDIVYNINMRGGVANVYNFLVFPYLQSKNMTVNTKSQDLYDCYIRAVLQGIQSLMCVFPNNQTTSGNCSSCVMEAMQNATKYNVPFGCLNCLNTNLTYQLNEMKGNKTALPFAGTVVFIIDNSGLLSPNFNSTVKIAVLDLILSYAVNIGVSKEDLTLLYLFCGVTGILIIILIIVSIYLNLKIRNISKNMLTSYDQLINKAQ